MRIVSPYPTATPSGRIRRLARTLTLLGATLLASSVLFVGCAGGDESGGKPANNDGGGCIVDTECNLGQICENNVCVIGSPGCETDDDCNGTDTCNILTGDCEPAETGCTGDADCGANETCNTATGDCEAPQTGCTADTDCGANETCNTATGDCEAIQTGCTSDADCGADETCNTATGVCEAAQTGCTADADCGANETCNTTTGDCEAVQTGCTADADCDANETCNTTTGDCEAVQTGCTANADCTDAAAPVCDTTSGDCVACLADGDCAGDDVCNATSHTCEAPPAACTANADCTDAAAPICDTTASVCVACLVDGDCDMNETCNATSHTCEAVQTGCTANADCTDAAAPICDTATGDCVECLANADCDMNEACNAANNTCIPAQTGCTANADCTNAAAPVCNTTSGLCVGCLANGDCSGDTPVCNTAASACVGCLTDGDCDPTESCNAARMCEVTGSCTNDAREPSDTIAQATAITDGQTLTGQICAGDLDTYAFTADANCDATLDLTFVHADGDLNLVVVNAEGNELQRSDSTTDNEQVGGAFFFAGTFYAIVEGATAEVTNSYDLTATITCTPLACPDNDDAFEPNDTFLESVDNGALPLGETASGILCSGADIFPILPGEGCLVSAELSFTQASGDLDLFLVAANGTTIDAGVTETDNESVIGQATSADPYFLVIQGFGDATNDYELTWDADCPTAPAACPADDAYEPNDTAAAAPPLSGADALSGALCGADGLDYYAATIESGCTFDANLTFTQATGDLDLFLLAADKTFVAGSTSETDNEGIAGTIGLSDTYYFVVAGYQGAENTYGFTLDVTCEALACTDDDVFEPNNTIDEAPFLPETADFRGILCDAADVYGVFVGSHCLLEAGIAFTHADGNLDLSLLDDTGAVLATSDGVTDSEGLAGTSPLDSVVYLSVEGASNSYDGSVRVTCTAPTCPEDDLLEAGGNDTLADAPLLPDNARFVATTCTASPDDYYAFDVEAGCFVRLETTFDGAAADIDLRLYNPAGTQVASSLGVGNSESVQLRAATAGTYTWWIDNSDGNNASYSATQHVNCGFATLACPADDAFEPNDTSATATDLPEGALATGITCGNADWYTTEVFQGCDVTVNAWFMHAGGDIDISVYDASSRALGTGGGSTTNNKTVTFTADADGFIDIEVVGYLGAQNPYELMVSQVCN